MSMILYKQGNILSPVEEDKITIICHQVNCKGIMGAGLAKQIRSRWPEVYNRYRHFCYDRLSGGILGHCQLVKADSCTWVANLFGQLSYGTDKKQTDYDALERALNTLRLQIVQNKQFSDVTVRIPYNMGCGLAGGNWNVVNSIITNIFNDSPIKVEIWKI